MYTHQRNEIQFFTYVYNIVRRQVFIYVSKTNFELFLYTRALLNPTVHNILFYLISYSLYGND